MHLLINLLDLERIGAIGRTGSPLNLMIRPDLGDVMHWDGVPIGKQVDDVWVAVESSQERVDAIQGGLDVVSRAKTGRGIRCKFRKASPFKD